jgi:copper transport protein
MPLTVLARAAAALSDAEGFGVGSPLYVGVRLAAYVCIAALVGAIAFRLLVLAPLERAGAPRLFTADVARRLRWLAVAAALGVQLFVGLRLPAQVAAMRAVLGDVQPIGAADVLTGVWGTGWRVEMAGAALALLAVLASPVLRSAWHVAVIACTGGIAVGQALSGHAAAASNVSTAVSLDALHVLGAGAWVGGIVALLVAGFPALAAVAPDDRGDAAAAVLRAFSPLALSGAAVLVVSGLYAAWIHIGSFSALAATGYGRFLIAKVVLVGAVAALGFLNWRRLGPRAGSGDLAPLRRNATLELTVAALVLVVTAILVAVPTPAEG